MLFCILSTIAERMSTHVLLGPSSATWDEANDITFDIAPCNDLISLADMRFQCDLHVMRADGTKLVDEDLVCPVNNMLSTLFQNVQVTLAGCSISDPSNLYFIRAYLENLLGYDLRALKSQLTCEGFVLDPAQDHDDPKGTWVPGDQRMKIDGYPNFENQDQVDRFEWIRDGMMQFCGKIHCDLFQQDKPLLPGVSLSLKFC